MVSGSFFSVAACSLIAVSILITGCSPGESSEIEQTAPVSVRVAPVVAEAEAEPLRFAGTVQARQRAELTFQVNGTLQSRPVKLGQAVERGEVLAKLYNPQLEPARDSAKARLRELQSQARQAKRELERAEKLHKRGVQSVQGLEQARAALEGLEASVATARAALAEAEQMVGEMEMRSPFAGRIESLSVEAGEFISAGKPVISLSAADGVEVEIRVPEYLLGDLAPGDELPVWLVRQRQDGYSGRVRATIAEVAQSSGDTGKLQTLVVHLEDPPATDTPVARTAVTEAAAPVTMAAVPVAGTPVEVGIPVLSHGALSVPMLSVMRTRDGAAVFRVREGKVQRVPVRIVQLLGENVLVRSQSLVPDDPVVFAGLSRLADGDSVEVLP